MKKELQTILIVVLFAATSFSQNLNWKICNMPASQSRVDDISMVTTQIGYAVCGKQTLKTIDGGDNWNSIASTFFVQRSVKFITPLKGFVGAFGYTNNPTADVFRKTLDGGITWIDLTLSIDSSARKGICGIAIGDSNTIYGCGNWSATSAYIVKSADGGNTWTTINMGAYASALIDMLFINADTGFVTGKSPAPFNNAIVLYTTNGGVTWATKFQNNTYKGYCWKIQQLTDSIYFASVEGNPPYVGSNILKSIDKGMTWSVIQVDTIDRTLQGVGFINKNKGWTGGWGTTLSMFETNNGGNTWTTIGPWCNKVNRILKINDSLLFATGVSMICKYSPNVLSTRDIKMNEPKYSTIKCSPNPTKEKLNIVMTLYRNTRALITLSDERGLEIKRIEHAEMATGKYRYMVNTSELQSGIYYLALKTHEDLQTIKVIVNK
jgi:photosystem II stability/assembly factor-like uncharacterized protein